MQTWTLWSSKDGHHLSLTNTPPWAHAVSWLADHFDAATGHVFCGSRAPDLLWRIPVGRPRYDIFDGERYLENSVAGLMHDTFGRFIFLGDTRAKEVLKLPVSREQAVSMGWQPYTDEEVE